MALGPELVTRAVHGDAAALAELMAEVRRLAVRYCRGRLGRLAGAFTTADDVAHDVCVAVLEALPRARGPLLAFVYGIAAHKVADALRAAHRTRTVPAGLVPEDRPDLAPSPEDAAVASQLWDRLRIMLNGLPITQREVVVLRIMVGLSAEQAGVALNMSSGAVRLAQHRALKRLRAAAGTLLDEVTA